MQRPFAEQMLARFAWYLLVLGAIMILIGVSL